jgi:transposase
LITLNMLEERISLLDKEIARRAREDEDARRLTTIAGIGPITATALVALAPTASNFRRARDFGVEVHSSGGKQRFGATSKMDERTLRRLLIMGASAVVQHSGRRGLSKESWLGNMLTELDGGLVKADQRSFGIRRFTIEIERIFHAGDVFAIEMGNAPHVPAPRLEVMCGRRRIA